MKKTGMCLHWTAGKYQPNAIELAEYHGGVVLKHNGARFEKWNDYTDNTPHCWNRNRDLVGLTVCGMFRATSNDWGGYPILPEQIDELCLAAAEVAYLKKIDTSNIKTHAEWALIDGYYPDRWDLAVLEQGCVSPSIVHKTGNELRKRIRTIKLQLMEGKRKVRKLHYENRRHGKIITN